MSRPRRGEYKKLKYPNDRMSLSLKKTLRVGFDARWYNDSGVGTYVAELLKAMAPLQQGFELIVYEDPANPVPGLEHLPLQRLPVRSGKYSVSGQLELARRQRRDRLDVFHSPFYVVPFLAGCPVVVTLHDLIPFVFDIDAWPKRSLVKMGYRAAALRSAHIITVSGHTARDVQKILGAPAAKISVVHNAVSSLAFHSRSDAAELDYLQQKYGVRRPYVVAASARNWRTKNLAIALQALALAQEQSESTFQTVIFGPEEGIQAMGGDDTAKCRHLNVLTTGYVAARELSMIFRHAELFIMPSLYEGFGLPVLEAMACGCAVITSDAGSLAEVAGEGAQTFDALDANGMAQAVVELLRNPHVLEKWQRLALRRAADFSWRKAAEETISIYHRVNMRKVDQT
ncbi:MAG TPA: glycosyltransferase family 1 protein [Candidatus Solibacter sp.]|nr:glycosyltransferase family 1 protein [Candidatus Solibacter sp.]